MDDAAGSLEALLDLADSSDAAGLPDAPWPPHYDKQAGEPPRVQPSKRAGRRPGRSPRARQDRRADRPAPASAMPLIEVARAATKDEAMAGLERWKQRHPDVWAAPGARRRAGRLDARAQFTTWTRIRLNLRHVPEAERPPQEALEVDYDPWQGQDPRGRP